MALDLNQLLTFQSVVHEGSFESAARVLHVTPAAVSQRIKALEEAVGLVLVRRARPCVATDAGRSLLRLAGQLALLEREALDAAQAPAVGGRTRVTVVVNADSVATWFLDALTGLTGELSFELFLDDEDHTADLLRDGSAMAAVTAQNVAVRGCRVQRLGAMRYLAVAAPEFHRTHFGDGDGFRTAPMVVFNRKDQLQHRFLTQLRRRVDPPVHYVPSSDGHVAAVGLGLGWGMVPELIARPAIAAGRYVELTPGRQLDVPLYWQYWSLDSGILGALTAAVTQAARATLR